MVSHRLEDIWNEKLHDYIAHVICMGGELNFEYYGSSFTIHTGEGMIFPCSPGIKAVNVGEGLMLDIIFVSSDFLEVCTPRNNYGIKGSLSLHNNPVMTMDADHFQQLQEDFQIIERRWRDKSHLFHTDIMICAVETMFLDFYNVHAIKSGSTEVSFQDTDIMSRFMTLLQQGEYVEHREVSYYADKLFVSPKYLSEVCKNVSGMTANYWITRFTVIHIRRLLRDKELSFTEIADKFRFSSLAYFSRFVQKNLGASPSSFRE